MNLHLCMIHSIPHITEHHQIRTQIFIKLCEGTYNYMSF